MYMCKLKGPPPPSSAHSSPRSPCRVPFLKVQGLRFANIYEEHACWDAVKGHRQSRPPWKQLRGKSEVNLPQILPPGSSI